MTAAISSSSGSSSEDFLVVEDPPSSPKNIDAEVITSTKSAELKEPIMKKKLQSKKEIIVPPFVLTLLMSIMITLIIILFFDMWSSGKSRNSFIKERVGRDTPYHLSSKYLLVWRDIIRVGDDSITDQIASKFIDSDVLIILHENNYELLPPKKPPAVCATLNDSPFCTKMMADWTNYWHRVSFIRVIRKR